MNADYTSKKKWELVLSPIPEPEFFCESSLKDSVLSLLSSLPLLCALTTLSHPPHPIIMTFEKLVVIDCKNHMLGRLTSVVAKELLKGQNVVLVRTEEINISGSLFRNKCKYTNRMAAMIASHELSG